MEQIDQFCNTVFLYIKKWNKVINFFSNLSTSIIT